MTNDFPTPGSPENSRSDASGNETNFILPPKSKYDDLLVVVYQLEAAYGHHTQRTLFAVPLNIRAVVTALLSHFYGNDDASLELDYTIFFLNELAKYKNCENWSDFFVRVKSFLTT